MSEAPRPNRPTLIALSGSLRGTSFGVQGARARLGTDPECELRFPPSETRPVEEEHAELILEEEAWRIRSLTDSPLIVNETPCRESRLFSNDLIRLGHGGPLLRFTLDPEGGRGRSFKQILHDSVALTGERSVERAGRPMGGARRGTAIARQVVADAMAHGTRRIRFALVGGSVLVLALIALAGFLVVRSFEARIDAERSERELAQGRQQAEQARALEDLRARNEELLAAAAEREAAREGELARALEESTRAREEVEGLRVSLQGGDRVYQQAAPGVCLIALGVAWWDPERSQFLRFETGRDGRRRFSGSGRGPVHVQWITGSGFLASEDGLVLTNRHVVDPWSFDEDFGKVFFRLGYRPVRAAFLGFFHGRAGPVPLRRLAVAKADVAVCGIVGEVPEGLEPLTLAPIGESILPGEPAIVMGFPDGLSGVINKVERRVRDALRTEKVAHLGAALAVIAREGGIRTTVTQGGFSGVTEEQLSYDAVTTSGGSGGPVLTREGQVIAINTAVSRNFVGDNFGQPIRLAHELLEGLGPKRDERPHERETAMSGVVDTAKEGIFAVLGPGLTAPRAPTRVLPVGSDASAPKSEPAGEGR